MSGQEEGMKEYTESLGLGHIRMQSTGPQMMSANISDISEALAKVQGKIEHPTAQREGQHGHRKFKFAPLIDCVEAVKELMAADGLAVTHCPIPGELHSFLVHTSGQWFRAIWPLTTSPDNPQDFGKELTYGRRYNFNCLLNIAPVEEDTDAAGVGRRGSQPPVQQPRSTNGDRGGQPTDAELAAAYGQGDEPAEPAGESQGEVVTGKLGQVFKKESDPDAEKPWKRFAFRVGDNKRWYSTFDREIGEAAVALEKHEVHVYYKEELYKGEKQHVAVGIEGVMKGGR